MNPVATLTVRPIAGDGEFHGPSMDEFFPEILFNAFGVVPMHRIHLIQLLSVIAVVLIMWLGERFAPLLVTMVFMILFMNITGIIPFLNMPGTAIIAVPLTLAIISYVTFIYAGMKKSPLGFWKNSLFPAGVPWPVYIIVTPLEFISTFIIRPVTLTLRLMMNLVVGHMILVLCFAATHFFFFTAGGGWAALGVGTLAFGGAFTLFEILVVVLQSYVFTVLTAIYIQLAVAEEH